MELVARSYQELRAGTADVRQSRSIRGDGKTSRPGRTWSHCLGRIDRDLGLAAPRTGEASSAVHAGDRFLEPLPRSNRSPAWTALLASPVRGAANPRSRQQK